MTAYLISWIVQLVPFILLIAIGVIFGSMNERRHFERLRRDEAALSHILQSNLKKIPDVHAQGLEEGAIVVTGSVVIALDYFKKIAAKIKALFGGSLRSYETMLERARREAIVRMLKEADALGATAVHNIRIEFSAIAGSNPASPGGAELLAYGTAVKAKT
jgi:uncharacterized protein YbjQ (UPF0145 family)